MTAKIVPTQRQVIGDQLLTALDDKSKVALVFNEQELTLLIEVLTFRTGYSFKRESTYKLSVQ